MNPHTRRQHTCSNFTYTPIPFHSRENGPLVGVLSDEAPAMVYLKESYTLFQSTSMLTAPGRSSRICPLATLPEKRWTLAAKELTEERDLAVQFLSE